jgi:hypothetical protein
VFIDSKPTIIGHFFLDETACEIKVFQKFLGEVRGLREFSLQKVFTAVSDLPLVTSIHERLLSLLSCKNPNLIRQTAIDDVGMLSASVQ